MEHQKYEQLARKWLEGGCTAAEELELFEYYEQYGASQFAIPERYKGNEDEYRDFLFKKIHKKIKRKSAVVSFGLWTAAASVAIVFFALVLNNGKIGADKPKITSDKAKHIINATPDQSEAILILNGRETLTLSSNNNRDKGDRFNLDQDSSGTLIYKINNANVSSDQEVNEIRTPNGKKLIVFLSDGTKVHLNTASSLKFPNRFVSAQRKVFLSGEAYFEVAKNEAMPFIVATATQEVQVLGTHFVVNSYQDEPDSKTTLLEGSVKIFAKKLQKSSVIRPGQQASVGSDNLTIKQVDAQAELSWIEGYFIFNNEDLESIMRKLQRHYGLQITYKTAHNPELSFAGKISQKKSLESILRIIAETGDVRFSVSGRRVTVFK